MNPFPSILGARKRVFGQYEKRDSAHAQSFFPGFDARLGQMRRGTHESKFLAVNLALGSAVASIGLTVPTVAAIAWWIATPLELGVAPGEAVLLALSFMMVLITYGIGRASLLSGVVHLILLATWLFLVVEP